MRLLSWPDKYLVRQLTTPRPESASKLLPALFKSFSERSPLRLGLTEKKKVTYLKVSIKFWISRTLLQLATMAKLRRWLLQCTKNFALGSFEVTLAWTPYTCPLIVEALSYPLPRHLLESKPHCSTLSTRTSEMVLASILCESTKPRKASSTSKLSVRYLTQTESYVFVDSSIVSSAITLKNFDFSICLTILSRISTPRQEINSFWICRDR